MARHRLSRDHVIWAFGPDLQPVLEVEPGDVVTFETNNCFSGQIQSEDDLATNIDLGRRHRTHRPSVPRLPHHDRQRLTARKHALRGVRFNVPGGCEPTQLVCDAALV